jgi:hypothetical protein
MKNFLRTSLYLTVFALAGILFQISCSADSNSTNSTPVGRLIYYKHTNGTPYPLIYTSNYDGTNETLVNVTLPAGYIVSTDSMNLPQLRISPDGQMIFFIITDSTTRKLYSCTITGANPTEVKDISDEGFNLGGAY